MSEHPVFESMERQIKFNERLPYYISFMIMWWGFCAYLYSILI